MRTKLFVTFAILIGGTSSVHAQRAPDLATLDRGDGITRIGLDMGLTLLDSPLYSAALRLEPYGQYVTSSGFGIYGAIPIARTFGGGEAPEPEDTFALGNLEIGGLYVIESDPRISWVFRGGLVVPTSSDGRDELFTNFYATWPRFTDLALVVPDAFYVRLSVSPLIHINKLFVRADLGIDIGSDDAGFADELLRINVGGGYDFGLVALGLELVNTYSFDAFDSDENAEHVVAGTVRFMGEALQPFLAIGTPLDDAPREEVSLFFAGGIQAVFR
ncbi:MAG: hypothetical protein AB7O24_01670 [Kofleriaceae bacterium]